jgi:hypothetical protein
MQITLLEEEVIKMDEQQNFTTLAVPKFGAAEVLAFVFVGLVASGVVADPIRVLALASVVIVVQVCHVVRWRGRSEGTR